MTTAPAVDERQHADVITAALKAALTALRAEVGNNVFDFGSVPGEDGNPGTLPEAFIAVALERRYVESRRQVHAPTRTGWRITCRYVARTVNNARLAALAIIHALDGVELLIDASETTPVAHESTTGIAPDQGGTLSGLSQWTYAC